MDFAPSARALELGERVRSFVEQHVVPLEGTLEAGPTDADLQALRARARAEGLFLPHLPPAWGGLGLGLEDLCTVFEEAGRSLLGPLALNCAAPDEGNMHILLKAGTEEQRERYLRPLAQGSIRSAFAMTEPAPGAGSDPTQMRTTAERDGSDFVLHGHKWFASGVGGAAFAIVAALSDPDAPPRDGMTLFLVDAGTPGFEVVRQIPVMGTEGPGGHGELRLDGVRVGPGAVLGEVDGGFALMQARLGPARLTHCMRWLGAAQRALEIAGRRALERRAFGAALKDHEAVQWMIADSLIDLHASRLMVAEAAWRLESGRDARSEASECKVFVAEAVGRVIDRAIQVCGSLGYSRDLPLERFYRDARAFRIYDGPSEVHRFVVAREFLSRLGGGRGGP
jgi:acyl-CoA dehydrogenase